MIDPSTNHSSKMNDKELEQRVQKLEEADKQQQDRGGEEEEGGGGGGKQSSEKGENFEALEELERLTKEIAEQEEELRHIAEGETKHTEEGNVVNKLEEAVINDRNLEEPKGEEDAEPEEFTADDPDAVKESGAGRVSAEASSDESSTEEEEESSDRFYWTDGYHVWRGNHVLETEQDFHGHQGANWVMGEGRTEDGERFRTRMAERETRGEEREERREARIAAHQARSMRGFPAAQARADLRERMLRAQGERRAARECGQGRTQIRIESWPGIRGRVVDDSIKIRLGNEMREMNRQIGRDLQIMRRDIEDAMAEMRRNIRGM